MIYLISSGGEKKPVLLYTIGVMHYTFPATKAERRGEKGIKCCSRHAIHYSFCVVVGEARGERNGIVQFTVVIHLSSIIIVD